MVEWWWDVDNGGGGGNQVYSRITEHHWKYWCMVVVVVIGWWLTMLLNDGGGGAFEWWWRCMPSCRGRRRMCATCWPRPRRGWWRGWRPPTACSHRGSPSTRWCCMWCMCQSPAHTQSAGCQKVHEPLLPTKDSAWSQKSGLGDGQEPRSSTKIMEPGFFHFISLCHQPRSQSESRTLVCQSPRPLSVSMPQSDILSCVIVNLQNPCLSLGIVVTIFLRKLYFGAKSLNIYVPRWKFGIVHLAK